VRAEHGTWKECWQQQDKRSSWSRGEFRKETPDESRVQGIEVPETEALIQECEGITYG
jgi:hypothetical protein